MAKKTKSNRQTERSRGSWKISFIGKFFTFVLLLFLCCCKKNIDVKVPDYVQKLVVEGKIDAGAKPEVYLSYTAPYFGNVTTNLEELAVKNALVTVSDGTTTDTLTDPFGKGYFYLDLNGSMVGVAGRTYSLKIEVNGKTYTSQTSIGDQVKLDSLWFKVLRDDSLGFIYAHLTEPSTPGNCYRWFAQRIGKDLSFLAPLGSAFDDKFINGKSFEFAYDRGMLQNSTATDDNNNVRSFFVKGDQVIVKFCEIGSQEYLFFRSYDANIVSNGNPFAAPTNLQCNISGENVLGIWCGYNPFIDTLICK